MKAGATAVEATTVEATTVEATTVEERQPTPAPTPAGPSARGNLVVPVILIICIGLLTSWGLMWSNARLLDRNAQATTRHLANSMLAIEARVLRNLVAAMAGGHEAHEFLIDGLDEAWAADNVGRNPGERYGISASYVVGADSRPIVGYRQGERMPVRDMEAALGKLGPLIDAARAARDASGFAVTGLAEMGGIIHVVAASPIVTTGGPQARPGAEPRPVLLLTRALDREMLRQTGAAFNLDGLTVFEGPPPDSYDSLPLKGVAGGFLGYLAWRDAKPGDHILWILTPSLVLALLAMTYLLYLFFRSTDLVLEREAYLASSLSRERELRDLKTRFVSMVSHELRTPLSTIRSAADLLDRYEGRMTPDERKHELEAIRSAVIGLARTMENVMLIGRSDASTVETHKTKFNLGEFCCQLWDETARAMATKHRLVLRGNAVAKTIDTDETFLRAALSNLFQNAIKYSPGCDEVVVEVAGDKSDCVIRVADSGPGIAPEQREAVFEAFHRGDNAQTTTGAGLGLAVAKAAAERLGGRISIEGGAGKGATFELRLPGLL